MTEALVEESLARSVARDVAVAAAGYPFDGKDDPRLAESELGGFALRWLLAILQRMGVMREPGEAYELDELKRRLGLAPKYDRYFEALIRRLEREGLVTLDGRALETTGGVRGYALEAVEEQSGEFRRSFPLRHPACAGLLGFMACCLDRFEEILTGRIDAADVLFQDGDMEVFAEVFRGDAVADYFNRAAADAVRSAVARLREHAAGRGAGTPKIRVLEIGAGTGGTTAAILEALRPLPDLVEICFSDISPSFVRYARRRFAAAYPWLQYRTLNIEKDLSAQGFELQSFDVVVAANVLHDTRDIELTLEQTRRLLRPGGLLVLNEFTAVKDCLFFSGALLHGYWLFEDPDRRLPDSCLLSPPQWSRALERTGFTLAGAFALPTQSLTPGCSQSVMLCESPPAAAGDDGRAGKSGLIGEWLEQDIRAILGEERSAAYSARRPLMEMGLDSIELVELKSLVRQRFDIKLPAAFLFEHETQEKMARALAATVSDQRLRELLPPPSPVLASTDAVAIVGVACRFAGGAMSPEAFWNLLERGGDGIVPMPPGRWRWPPFVDVKGRQKGIDQGGFLERIDEFDARFFRTSPREAELMDPQQRMLLELSWEALEDAGRRPSELSGRRIGVFVGVCQSDYRDVLVAAADSPEGYLGSGSALSMLANRLSYFYDFKGPSLAVDTACSSSLFALHDAVNALRRGDCEQALVGGINLLCSPTISISYYQAGMLSPTGRCRTFDAAADGYVRGEGGAMLLLKPLALAIEQGDAIYGLVRGTAVNHGGQATTLTAPKPDAQAAVIEAAWLEAGVAPDSAGYVETHGTGTRLGDPIEISGLVEAFQRLYKAAGRSGPARPHCGLGSVKSNVGHLEGAAGLAGLIKILMSIRHGQIPRTLNFQHLNPDIDLHGSPFYIVERNTAWTRCRDAEGRELPRRASVSSFGFGGANSHAVVEEYPIAGVAAAGRQGALLIPLSARTPEGLAERARRLLDFLEMPAGSSLARVVEDLGSLLRGRFGLGEECAPDLEWEDLGWGVTETRLFLAAVEEAHGVRLHSRSLLELPSLGSLAERIAGEHGGAPAGPDAGDGTLLEDVAYTLQVGREPMEERVAFLVESRQELASALRSYVAGDREIGGCHRGYARPPQAGAEENAERREVEAALARGDLRALASLWCRGVEVDWARLYPAARPRRVRLPAYPFARERHWVKEAPAAGRAGPASHPLLNQRDSEVLGHRFGTVLSGDEFFLADHVIQGRRMLPAVAYLEMARAAVERAAGVPLSGAAGEDRVWLGSVAWVRPLCVDGGPARVNLRLTPDGEGLSFEIYSDSEESGGAVFHGQGRAGIAAASAAAAAPPLDLAKQRARCTRARYSGEDCYRAFSVMGYEYGPGQRGIDELYVGTGEILARLTLPASLAAGREEFVLHPAMADSAVQATIGFALAGPSAAGAARPAVPFEVRRVELFAPCASTMWAAIRRGDGAGDGDDVQTFDIDLCDEAGRLSARFEGWTTRRLKQGLSESLADERLAGEMLLRPEWEPVEIVRPEASGHPPAGRMAIVGGTDREWSAIQELYPGAALLELEPGDGIDQLRRRIASWGAIGHLVWIVPHHRPDSAGDGSLLAAQGQGVLFGFRLIKALLGEGYGDQPLAWSVITTGTQAVHPAEPASPTHAGVHGLIGSMAQEYAHWDVRLVDLPSLGDRPWRDLFALAGDPHGNAAVYRNHRWHRQRLVPSHAAAEAEEEATVYRPGGVYVVIGGAGGIGEAWSEAVLRRTPAQLVWIGRRPLDAALRARLDRLAGLGPAPLYIAADATDRAQLEAARDTVKRAFGRIDGVIHAAMVIADHSLENMTEEEFAAGLSPKADVCVRLAQAFAGEPLEFVLFFSSIAAFLKWPGQSNYVAGCAFEDAFASRLAAEWPCRVRVVNWGYWSVGALDSERYRSLMARKGLGSIGLPGAMRVLDRLLTGPDRQLAYLAATGPQALAGLGARPEERETQGTLETASGIAGVMARPREVAAGHLLVHLRRRVAETLGVAEATLDSRSRPFAGALLGEFGMDSLSSNSLRNTLRRELGVDVPVQRILGDRAHAIAGALYEQLLLQRVSNEPRREDDGDSETFVF
jgi:polyketide synthase PksM